MQYEKSFKEEAVKLSDEIGVKAAANQLGIPYYSLSTWRNNRKKYNSDTYVGSGHKRMSADNKEQRILELEKENAELKHSNEILQEALGFFAVRRKK
jgi:transposase